MANIIDETLEGLSDTFGSFFSKIKDTATKGAKTYASATPQGQAVMAAKGAMESQGKKSGTTPSAIVSTSTGKGKTGIFSFIMSKKMFGLPIIPLAAGLGYFMLRRKK